MRCIRVRYRIFIIDVYLLSNFSGNRETRLHDLSNRMIDWLIDKLTLDWQNSASSSSSTSSGVSSGSERCLATAIAKPSSYSLPRPRYLPALPSPSPRTGKTIFSRRSLPATPDSPSRSVHAGCIIRVSIEGMEDRRSGGVVYRGIWVSQWILLIWMAVSKISWTWPSTPLIVGSSL